MGESSVVSDKHRFIRGARRIGRLWNEHETPSQSGLAEDEWQRLCTIYDRACEVSGMQLTLDGQPFELHNSWETAEEDARSS